MDEARIEAAIAAADALDEARENERRAIVARAQRALEFGAAIDGMTPEDAAEAGRRRAKRREHNARLRAAGSDGR